MTSVRTGELSVCLIEIVCFLLVVSGTNTMFCFLGEYLSPICVSITGVSFKNEILTWLSH